MGNLVGVVAAVSVGGAGAVFWMWVSAFLGASTAYVEGTLAQLHKKKDPLYGGYHGGPAYYIHDFVEQKRKKKIKKSFIAILFAIFGLICWCGISQVVSNSVTSAFKNAFSIPPIYTTVVLVIIAAVIVLRKNATVKVLDIIVPIMAVVYFLVTIFIIVKNINLMPGGLKLCTDRLHGVGAVLGVNSIDLIRCNDLGACSKLRIIGFQFLIDGINILNGISAFRTCRIHDMDDHLGTLNMAQELMSQSHTFGSGLEIEQPKAFKPTQ